MMTILSLLACQRGVFAPVCFVMTCQILTLVGQTVKGLYAKVPLEFIMATCRKNEKSHLNSAFEGFLEML